MSRFILLRSQDLPGRRRSCGFLIGQKGQQSPGPEGGVHAPQARGLSSGQGRPRGGQAENEPAPGHCAREPGLYSCSGGFETSPRGRELRELARCPPKVRALWESSGWPESSGRRPTRRDRPACPRWQENGRLHAGALGGQACRPPLDGEGTQSRPSEPPKRTGVGVGTSDGLGAGPSSAPTCPRVSDCSGQRDRPRAGSGDTHIAVPRVSDSVGVAGL